MRISTHRFKAACAAVALAALVSACGGSSSNTSTASTSKANAPKATSSSKANTTAATAAIAPYTKAPGAFPVDAPLSKPLPKGTSFAYLQCSTPVCAQQAVAMDAAVKAIGGKFVVAKAPASTQGQQQAFSTLLDQKPHAILLPAIEPDSVTNQLVQAKSDGIPTVSTGIMDSAQNHITAASFGTPTAVLAGKLMADWVVAKKGAEANVVSYVVPELSFATVLSQSFTRQMKALCPTCTVRNVDIPSATIGSTAPSQMVSDLQAHPSTNVAMFTAMEEAQGLPAALKDAGISNVTTIGFAPSPENLEDIKSGGLTEALGLDIPTMIWTMVDEAARLTNKEPLTSGEQAQIMPMQFLGQSSITFNPADGWTGYPNYAERFKKLWGVG
jgi:ribose transport system substrate-binding protein